MATCHLGLLQEKSVPMNYQLPQWQPGIPLRVRKAVAYRLCAVGIIHRDFNPALEVTSKCVQGEISAR